jgi:3-phosphoshikimate 1-carboxyvinyltransferase
MSDILLQYKKLNSQIKNISIPGSKSYTNRALIIASLSDGVSVLHNCLLSDDTERMIDCLQKLGIKIDLDKDKITVCGRGGVIDFYDDFLDCGIAGTTTRFISALSIINKNKMKISASGEMQKRPMSDLFSVLEKFGKKIEYCNNIGCVPVVIDGAIDENINTIEVSGTSSSQFLSSILMVSPLLKNGLKIRIIGELVSKSYVDLTIDAMKYFGVSVDNLDYKRFIVAPQKYQARDYIIESDWSSAVYFFAYTTLSKQAVRLYNLNLLSKQGDCGIVELFKSFGIECVKYNDFIELNFIEDSTNLNNQTVNMENMPDTAITVAMVASVLLGEGGGFYKINGLSTLKKKETDRLLATKNELEVFDYKVETGEDFIVLYGKFDNKIDKYKIIKTYSDHRVAMTFALMSIMNDGIIVKNSSVVNKSYPKFWRDVLELGISGYEVVNSDKNIILTGFRGCGKSVVGDDIAKILRKKFIDLDYEIEKKIGHSIFDFVDKNNWESFRIVETILLFDVLSKSDVVISFGGGCCANDVVILDRPKLLDEFKKNKHIPQEIIDIIKDNNVLNYGNLQAKILRIFIDKSLTFFINSDLENIIKRISENNDRPMLNSDSKNFIEDLTVNYNKRYLKYKEIANFEVKNNDDIKSTVAELIDLIYERK